MQEGKEATWVCGGAGGAEGVHEMHVHGGQSKAGAQCSGPERPWRPPAHSTSAISQQLTSFGQANKVRSTSSSRERGRWPRVIRASR